MKTRAGAKRKSLYGFASVWVISSRKDAQTHTNFCLYHGLTMFSVQMLFPNTRDEGGAKKLTTVRYFQNLDVTGSSITS